MKTLRTPFRLWMTGSLAVVMASLCTGRGVLDDERLAKDVAQQREAKKRETRLVKQAGNRTTGIIGFRNKDLVFWEDKFGAQCDQLIVCTDDGSAGIKGLVTEGIATWWRCARG